MSNKQCFILAMFNNDSLATKELVAKVNQLVKENPDTAYKYLLEEHLTPKACLGVREYLETNPTVVQIIPYVVLHKDELISNYRRNKGVGETRLVGKVSVGWGGHVDTAMPYTHTKPTIYSELIKETIKRELEEELILPVEPNLESLVFKGLIYLDTSAVNAVHLGLVFTLPLLPTASKETELEFLDLANKDTLLARTDLEDWTRYTLEELL